MREEEVPTLLLYYLGDWGLVAPIIPYDALKRWPEASAKPHLQKQNVLDQCQAIANLGRSRRDLLMYLLIYMAKYVSASMRDSATEELTLRYGPYICGCDYRRRRERDIVATLIKYTKRICLEFALPTDGKVQLKTVITGSRQKLEKQKAEVEAEAEAEAEAEEDRRRKQEAWENRNLFAKATSKVKRMFD